MSDKPLIINVTTTLKLNYDESPRLEVNLSVPIEFKKEKLKELHKKGDRNLGTINLSEQTSKLIQQTGEAISKELLSKL